MDYDDNDFQSQNFQLDDSKFPPSLQSLALPKFDFDEHLQVHLRFDSLVDTEVLLGIQGQDNNWIQDFSSGTSAIEFSSSAADNCSISRHNNVWSEATSSESVEMLLRSVGENEMSDRKAFAMEADAQNRSDCLIDQTGLTLEQVDDINSMIGEVKQNDPSVPPDKFQSPLLVQDKDEARIQPRVEGMSQIISSEIFSSELDTSSLDNKFESDGMIDTGKCTTDVDTTLPGNDTCGNCLTVSETSCKMVPNVTPVDIHFTERPEGDACEGSDRAGGNCGPVASRSTQDDHLSVSNPVTQSGGFINQVHLEHVAEEHTMASITERSELLSDDAHKKESPISEGGVNRHFLEEVKADFPVGNGSSILGRAKDSMVLVSEGCNVGRFSGNPDGLLESIAYPVKALNNDEESVGCSMEGNDTNALAIEGQELSLTDSVKIKDENNSNQLIGHNYEIARGVSEIARDVDVPIHIDSKTQLKGTQDDGTESEHLIFDSQNAEPAAVQKSDDAEVIEDEKKADSESITSGDVMLAGSPLSGVFDNVEVKLPVLSPGESHNAAEPSDVCTPLEVSAGGDTGLSISPNTTNPYNEGNAVCGKTEDTISGEKVANIGGVAVPTTKILVYNRSVNMLSATEVELCSLKKSENIYQAHPGNSLLVDKGREQDEAALPKSPAPDSTYSDENEMQTSGLSAGSVLKSNTVVQLPIKPLLISDAVAANYSPSRERNKDMLADIMVASFDVTVKSDQPQDIFEAEVASEKKEGAKSGPLSDFVQSDENESKISTNFNLRRSECNVDVQVSSGSLAGSDAVKDNTPNTTAEPQADNLGQSSSLVDKPTTHGQATEVEGNLINDESVLKGIKYSGDAETSHEHNRSPIRFADAVANSGTKISTPLPRNNADDQPLEVETGNQSLPEPSYGSPSVISCDECSPDKSEGGDVHKVKPTLESKAAVASEDDKNFAFEVGAAQGLSGKDIGKLKPFSNVHEPSKILKENCEGCHLESERENDEVISKTDGEARATNEVKAGCTTGSSNDKLTTGKGKHVKGTSARKKSSSTGKSCSTSGSSSAHVRSSGRKLEDMQQYVNTESSSPKASGTPIVQTASLPDLNSSTTLFHQPFTDQQQVQLRAQIFVYGSLIQGIPPDETCMLSAFGETDAGRSSWVSVWRMLVERHQSQKSPVNSETPLHAHSIVRISEKVSRCNSVQTKPASTTSRRSSSKVLPSPIPNSTPPLPSPLWSASTHDGLYSNLPRGAQLDFNQALSPLNPYPSSQTRQYTSSTPPWLPQNLRPGPWAVTTHSSMLNASTQYTNIPVVETIQVTPGKESSMSRATNVQLVSPNSLVPTLSPASIAPASAMQLETQGNTASPGNNKTASKTQKPRKRKKSAETEELAQTLPVSQSTSAPAFSTVVSLTTSSVPSPSSLNANTASLPLSVSLPAKIPPESTVVTSIAVSPTRYQIIGSCNTEQRVIFSEETCNKIEQAKLQAEDAAALAASVVAHSQGMWSKLAFQKNSGLVIEVEEKLASAAVAAAAAASVAKAAAAAAKIASDAALQAKMMADEALDSAKPMNLIQSSETVFDSGKNFVRVTPGSILKSKDNVIGSSSIISAAREATRRRIEAASAATKRAENLDAIMRAAELAAEAVYQVGTIVAMGDPLPFKLSELVEAGPDGYWKVDRSTSENISRVNNLCGKEQADLDLQRDHFEQTPYNNKQIQITATEEGRNHNEQSIQSAEKHPGMERRAGDVSTVPQDNPENDKSSSNLKENAIQKRSVVEVISDEDGLRGGWFSARVIDVKDNKACVCYNNLLSDDGSGQLKEWVSLDSEINGAPRIRVAHPTTVLKSDGTKKRRREVVGNYVWEVGDRVDAWMRDGWWEGIIIEKSQEDDTKLTVHFPAGGDSSVVRAWDLRPSLTWRDGQWLECSRTRENTIQLHEGDTPLVKRQKICRLESKTDAEVDGRVADKLSKKIPPEDTKKTEDLLPLNLAAKDKIFSVGKNVNDENISDALKVKRTGLQKEGSKVVFGVPKPGKKRKFMDVSKHYVSDKSDKANQGNDSVKFAKYLMPQASRPWRNTTKVDLKGKGGGDSKSVGVKSVKPKASRTRNPMEKDTPSLTTLSAANGRNSSRGASPNVGSGFSNEEKNPEKNTLEVVSFPRSLAATQSLVSASSTHSLPTVPSSKKKSSSTADAGPGGKERPATVSDRSIRSEEKQLEDPAKATQSLLSASSTQPLPTAPSTKKKSSSTADTGPGGKERPATVSDRSIRSEEKQLEDPAKATPGATEPRRSNRKIQPTSRLLEGLQSSLIISKIPTFSQDKGSRGPHKGSSRGNPRG